MRHARHSQVSSDYVYVNTTLLLLFYDVIFPDYKRMAKKSGNRKKYKDWKGDQDGGGLRHEAHLLPQKH